MQDSKENGALHVSAEDQAELKSLHTELARLYDLPGQLVCVLDEQSRFKRVNRGFTAILGYSPQDLIGKPIWDFIHPEDRDLSIQTEQLGRTTVIHDFENRFRAKSNAYRWLRWTGTIVDGLNYGAAIDVTELRTARQKLEESQARLAAVLEYAPIGLCFTDADGNLEFMNREGVAIWKGLKSASRDEYDQYEAWFEETGKRIQSHEWALARAVSHGETTQNERLRIRAFDGREKHVLNSAGPILSPNGERLGGVAAILDISSLKEYETALRTSEARLHSFINNAPAAIYYKNLAGEMLIANQMLCDLTGQSRDSILGKTDFDLFPEAIAAQFRENDTIAIQEKHTKTFHETLEVEGILHSFLTTKFPVLDDRKNIIGLGGISVDITEQKRIEEALHESEARLRSVLENMSEGLMLFDAKGNLIYQNPASLRIHGFESDTEGRISSSDLPTTWEAWDEARRPIAFGEWPVSRVFRKERFSNQVLHVRRVETGHEFDGSYNGSPIFDQNGELIMGFITIRDITGQVAATQALTESEKRLSTFMEAMPQMAFIADPQGNVTYYNKRHYEYFGVEPGQTEGWAWKDKQIHHPDDLQRTVERWQHSLKTGAPYQIEYRLRRHDGAFLWHLGRAYPVRGENGRILCWTGTNTNIHDQKEMEQELRDALRIRDEFLSIASHELKTPITTIRLQTQNQERLVKKAECGDLPIDRLKKSTAMVSAQVSRLTALVNDMLDVSRISAGKLSLNREPINLSELLRETIDCEHPGLRAANIPLTLDVQEPVIIEGDRLRLSQVMSNLISNVTKYAPGKPLTIRLTTSGDFAHLEVEDQGPGISRDYIGRIFERYERAVQNPTAITGLGLGLYISRQIVKAHGGEIWAENSPDGGAKFTVKIPKTQHSTHHEQGVTT